MTFDMVRINLMPWPKVWTDKGIPRWVCKWDFMPLHYGGRHSPVREAGDGRELKIETGTQMHSYNDPYEAIRMARVSFEECRDAQDAYVDFLLTRNVTDQSRLWLDSAVRFRDHRGRVDSPTNPV